MDLYHAVLFLHITGAIALVGGGFVFPFIGARLRGNPTVAEVRNWTALALHITKVGGFGAILLLTSGLYMALTAWSLRQGWLAVALTLFIVNASLAGAKVDPALKAIQTMADEAPDGPVPAQLSAALNKPGLFVIEATMLSNDVVIVFLMSNKPGFAGALTAAAVGAAVAIGRISYRARTRAGAKTAVAA